MRNKKAIQFTAFTLFVLTVFSAFLFPAAAESFDVPDHYESVLLPNGYTFAGGDFSYTNKYVSDEEYYYYEANDCSYVWYDYIDDNGNENTVYGVHEEIEKLRGFLQNEEKGAGISVTTSIARGAAFSPMYQYALLGTLTATLNEKEVPVNTLNKHMVFSSVYVVEPEKIFFRKIGEIYQLTDDTGTDYYGFVYFDELDNSHFDANGNLSYRSGTVTFYNVSKELVSQFEQAQIESNDDFSEYLEQYYRNQNDDDNDDDNNEGLWATGVIILFALFGVILPCTALIVGLILASSRKKNPHAKRWLLVSLLAVIWFLLALSLFLMLILA